MLIFIIFLNLILYSLKRASQLDTNRRRSTRKIAENKHVSVTKKKVDEIIDKEPRVSQYLKIDHDNRRKGSNSRIWTVSEKTVNAKKWSMAEFIFCDRLFILLRVTSRHVSLLHLSTVQWRHYCINQGIQDHDTKIRRQFKHLEIDGQKTGKNLFLKKISVFFLDFKDFFK